MLVADSGTSPAELIKQLSVQVLRERSETSIRGTIALESRKVAWRKFAQLDGPDEQARARPTLSLSEVDPWQLPIDASPLILDGKLQGKKTFEFPDMRTNAACTTCNGTALARCEKCCGYEPTDCFWCAGTGRFKSSGSCDHCASTGKLICHGCKNEGTVKCIQCKGFGSVAMALCVDVRLSTIDLPPRPLTELIGVVSQPLSAEDLRSVAISELHKTVQDLHSLAVKTSPSGKIPVLARCVVEHSTVWDLAVHPAPRSDIGMNSHHRKTHSLPDIFKPSHRGPPASLPAPLTFSLSSAAGVKLERTEAGSSRPFAEKHVRTASFASAGRGRPEGTALSLHANESSVDLRTPSLSPSESGSELASAPSGASTPQLEQPSSRRGSTTLLPRKLQKKLSIGDLFSKGKLV